LTKLSGTSPRLGGNRAFLGTGWNPCLQGVPNLCAKWQNILSALKGFLEASCLGVPLLDTNKGRTLDYDLALDILVVHTTKVSRDDIRGILYELHL